ncbi:MAG: OsmC family protein [Gemmatimonadaceae bacterium]
MTTNGEDGGSWVVSRIGRKGFRTEVSARSHQFAADEPVALGGTDVGPTPYEYLLTALRSCTATTLRMYADRKAWPLERAEVFVRQARSHEPDCEKCETDRVGVERVERRIEFRALATASRIAARPNLDRSADPVLFAELSVAAPRQPAKRESR